MDLLTSLTLLAASVQSKEKKETSSWDIFFETSRMVFEFELLSIDF